MLKSILVALGFAVVYTSAFTSAPMTKLANCPNMVPLKRPEEGPEILVSSQTRLPRLNKSRMVQKFKNLNRAGKATRLRFVHYSVGLLSVGFGLTRVILGMVIGFQNIQCTDSQLFIEGFSHSATSFFGLFRIDWREGETPARRALMAPSIFVNMFLWSLLYTDYVVPSTKATFASVSMPVLLQTVAIGLLMPYILLKQNVPGGKASKSGAPLDTPRENMFLGFLSFIFPIFNIWSTFVWATLMRGSAGIATQQATLVAFPQYGVFMRNSHLGVMFLNNIASLIATFSHYGIMTDEKVGQVFAPFVATIFLSLLKIHYTAPWASILAPNADPPNYVALPIVLISIATFFFSRPEEKEVSLTS